MKNLTQKLKNLPTHIGIIDSGIGGISVLNALSFGQSITHAVYVADTAYLPYGQQPYEVLLSRGRYITEFLLSKNIDTVIVACHTASATVLPELQLLYPQVTFIDLLIPTVSQALTMTCNKNIGVFATYNTIQSERYLRVINSMADGCIVVQQACPEFVPLLEAQILDHDALERAIDNYLEPILKSNIDTLILGCTHYAFLNADLEKRINKRFYIVSAYSCIQTIFDSEKQRSFKVDFFVTGPLEIFKITVARVLDTKIFNIEDSTYTFLG